MIVFLGLSFCFSTVLSVGAVDTIRISNAVTFVQSETVEIGRHKPISNDYGFVNLETRTRKRRQTIVRTPLNANDIEEVLDIHNALRRLEPASDMQYMTWNSYLADMATEWSSKCIWGHGQPERKPSTMPFNPLGQNLYLSTGASLNISFLVWRWYSEKPFYNYTTATCETEEMCGHFTQVVWSQSREVGCGKYLCPEAVDKKTNEIYTNAWIFSCNYGPAGNYNGIRPYALGEPCTACISGQMWCDREEPRGLCRRDCNQTSDTCECKASCKNQGVVNQSSHSCSCQCTNGWGDGDCGKSCCDYNSLCGNSWPKAACYDQNFGDLIRSFCFETCGLCTDATPTEQASCPVFTTIYKKTTAYNDNSTFSNITFVPLSSTAASSTLTLPTTTLSAAITSTTTYRSSTTTLILTNPTTASAVPVPTIPMTTSTTTSTTTPIPTTTMTTSMTKSIPTNPVTTTTTTSSSTPVLTNPLTTSTSTPIPTNPVITSTTTPIQIIPVTTSTTTSSTTPLPTIPSTTTSIPVSSTTTSTTNSSPVSRLLPTASISSGPNDATASNGGFAGSIPSQMLWMIVIVSTLGAVIVLVIVIVVILLLLCRSRIKKQSHKPNESSRPHEINRYTAMTYNASAPPPVNPFFQEDVVALHDIQGHVTEDNAKVYPPSPEASFQTNISAYK